MFKKTESNFSLNELTVKNVEMITIGGELRRVFYCETEKNRIMNTGIDGMRTLSEAVVLGEDGLYIPASRDKEGAIVSNQVAGKGDIIIAFSKDFFSIWEHGFSATKRAIMAHIIIARTYFLRDGISNITLLYEKVCNYLMKECDGVTKSKAKSAWKSLNRTEEKFIGKYLAHLAKMGKNTTNEFTANEFEDADLDEMLEEFDFEEIA